MSVILRCTNDNGIVQDIQVQDQVDLRLDISAIENATIGDVYGISSQEFSLVGSDAVNAFFGNVWNIGATPAVALQNSIECQVLLNGAEVFKGKLYIKNIITDSDGLNSLYNVIVVNETVDFKFEIQDLYINQLDLSKFDHDLTYANISASWGSNLFSGSIIYPFVNYGSPEGDADAPDFSFAAAVSTGSNTFDNYNSPLRLIDFKPTIRAKDVVDAIFSGSSYDYTSSFFNTDYFKSLYVLPTANDQLGPNNTSPVSQSAWAYNASGSQTLAANTVAKVDFDAEIIDNGNNFSLVNERYTADTTGNYQYQINISYYINNWFPSATDRVTIQLRKNGGSIIDSQVYFNPPATGSAFLQSAVNLVPADYLEVEMAWSTTSGTRTLTIRNDQGQPSYYPAGYLTYFQVKGPASLLGGNVEIAEQFPDDLKALDFMQGLIEKFNLVVEPVPNSRNLIRIEPYQNWINAGAQKDWTNKVDRNTRYEITHPITEQPRTIVFSDEDDDDVLNEYTLKNKGRTFGSYTFVSDSDLAEGERRVGKVFAATPVTGIPNGRTFVVPHLCSLTDNKEFRPIKFKPRLLYNNGLQPVPQSALGISGSVNTRGTIYVRDENSDVQATTIWNQMSTLTAIPVNYNTGQDLHFNNDQFAQYFQASANGKVKADAYRTYWATYINSLYDIDARKLVCNVYIKPTEIQNIALNDKIFIDGHYYRINRINGANLTRRDTVEVELIKILAQELIFPKRRVSGSLDIALDYGSLSINGTGRYVDVNTGATVDDFNQVRQVAAKDYMQLYNNAGTASVVWDYQVPTDTTSQLNQSVLGTNRVNIGASKVNALGNNNEVKEGSETTLVVGSANSIGENTANITALGQNHSVNELVSNAQILGGIGNTVSSSNNSVIVGGTGSLFVNNDWAVSINGENDAIRDSDFTTTINSHANEVIINGSGHTVIGLNLEGAGLDLLNYRNNSNWLGDTYLGEAIFRERYQLECGDGYSINLTGSNLGQGKHDNLYILNWSGLSPGTTTIELPNAVNNDYKKIVYQFQANGTFDGTTEVNFTGFSGQTINGLSSYSLSEAYDGVTFTTSGSGWLALAAAGEKAASYLSAYNTSSITTTVNVSASVPLPQIDFSNHISVVSGSRITFDKAGVYDIQFSAQVVKTTATNAPLLIWIAKNGVDVAWTNTEAIIAGNANDEIVLAWNWYVEAQSGDYYEIKYVDTQGNVTFQSKTGTIGPDVPSWIVTVGSIGGGNAYLSGSGGGGATFPYTGSAQITGSLTVTGSVIGNVTTMTITNSTASMDLSKGNAFYLFLNTGSVLITGSNINPNQHVSLFVSQSGNNNLYFDNSFYFSTPYTASQTAGAKDILTFETYTVNPGAFLNTSINKNLVSQSGAPVAASYPSASGGLEIISGSYRIHKFTSSADFTVHTTGSTPNNGFETLVVAGGGGGGSRAGGGGGAGGVIYMTSSINSFTATTYRMTVGAGGAGAIDGVTGRGANGNDSTVTSSLATIFTAKGGGGGGGYPYASDGDGGNGGSGGGGQSYSSTVTGLTTQSAQAGNSGTYGYGNNGAPATTSGGIGGGGGGAGVAPSGTPPADSYINGGDGIQVNISGSFYVGGGGGGGDDCATFGPYYGLGGAGGGANGGDCNDPGNNATANTGGGGGGGGGSFQNGGNGGSGLIIVKYKYQA